MSLQAAKLPRTQGFLMMIERLIIFGGLFGLVSAANLTPSGAVICYIAAPAAMIFVGIYRLRSYIFAAFSVDRQFLKKIVAYSAPLAPMTLVGYLSGTYLDAIFVSKYLSTNDLGVYSVATQINGIALQLPTLSEYAVDTAIHYAAKRRAVSEDTPLFQGPAAERCIAGRQSRVR